MDTENMENGINLMEEALDLNILNFDNPIKLHGAQLIEKIKHKIKKPHICKNVSEKISTRSNSEGESGVSSERSISENSKNNSSSIVRDSLTVAPHTFDSQIYKYSSDTLNASTKDDTNVNLALNAQSNINNDSDFAEVLKF